MVFLEDGTRMKGQGELNAGNGGRLLSQLDFGLGMVATLALCHKFSFKNYIYKWIRSPPLTPCPGLQLLGVV